MVSAADTRAFSPAKYGVWTPSAKVKPTLLHTLGFSSILRKILAVGVAVDCQTPTWADRMQRLAALAYSV